MQQLSFWSDAASAATVKSLSIVERRKGQDGLGRHRTAIQDALSSLQAALRDYLEASSRTHPLRSPGDASEHALRRLCDTLHAEITLRENLGLCAAKHRRLLVVLGDRPPAAPDACGLTPAELDKVWRSLPDDQRLGFVVSLNDAAANALLRFQVDRQQ
jgi:hypothetical protein